MTSPDPIIQQTGLEAKDYWAADGIPSLVDGMAFTAVTGSLFATYFAAQWWATLPAWGWLWGAIIVLWLPAVIWFLVWYSTREEDFKGRIKARLIYPRTGYVAPPSYWTKLPEEKTALSRWLDQHPELRSAFKKWPRLLFFFLILPFGVFFASRRFVAWAWLTWIVLAVAAALPAAISSYKRKLPKNKLYWIEILAWPIYLALLALLRANHYATAALCVFLLAPGLFMILRGALFLAWYIRRYPLAETPQMQHHD